ncbi:hypothetical protein [Chryseobacterium caseinilyticum]|uniref:DUF3575 domain-containing protein n=1 Tax=Chryseobacterium caseinilyticum TaxID=2771428 RepID=A0ABR8ZBV5_9FLAO|nr:hypothetical protein [Chryseobacterium caseinilyticum]MBD8082726.1 hypothetical protein [Chryseobacterium caseinilyticum]
MKKLLSVLIFFVSTLIFAQEEKESKWILKLNPSQLADAFSFPTVMVSAERMINPYFSISAEAGVQVYETFKIDSTMLNSKGFKANIEGRFYFSKFFNKRTTPKRNQQFVALQLFSRKNQTTDILRYYPTSDNPNNEVFTDYFGVKKRVLGVNLIMGNQISILRSKRLILEPYYGIGFMNRKIENTALQFGVAKHEIQYGNHEFFRNRMLEKGSGNFLNLVVGFRIGYKL